MPRQSRLDAPGVLHHVIIRGIEKKKIFRNEFDSRDFVDRLAGLVPDTETRCYAWVLMTNHAHFLFRSGPAGIATLMRRLLTGYVVNFNRRHNRHGHLFQNRYKSIICQEDVYLKELVRYIHLNPLRAKMVPDLKALKKYPYCGHGILMGRKGYEWQDSEYILNYFGPDLKTGRRQYHAFVRSGLNQGRRPELVGGGLVRSLGGWKAIKKIPRKGMERAKGDQRILGDSDFVLSMLKSANEKYERGYELQAKGIDIEFVIKRVSDIYEIDPKKILSKGRQRKQADARGLLCY